MDETYLAAITLAACEVLPADKSDLNPLLLDPKSRQHLAALNPDHTGPQLLTWLCEVLDLARIEFWHKRLDRLARDSDARPLLIGSPQYPVTLAGCWDAPPLLFVRGRLAQGPALAIVGSRSATPDATASARALARHAAADGITVVSGLAAGIDAAAHRGALDADGDTVAVMGTGITRVFPAEHEELAEGIAARGALLSQFAPDAPRTSTTFLWRNSVIAGLADVNVVMSATERSGSRHQAEQAMRYGRPVLLWAPALTGVGWAEQAVASGAAAFVEGDDEVLQRLRQRSATAHRR